MIPNRSRHFQRPPPIQWHRQPAARTINTSSAHDAGVRTGKFRPRAGAHPTRQVGVSRPSYHLCAACGGGGGQRQALLARVDGRTTTSDVQRRTHSGLVTSIGPTVVRQPWSITRTHRPVTTRDMSLPAGDRAGDRTGDRATERQTMYAAFQAWAVRNYGDSGKTKTVTCTKYERIMKILRGDERPTTANTKFRLWVRAKGFRLEPCRRNSVVGQVLCVPSKDAVSSRPPMTSFPTHFGGHSQPALYYSQYR